MEFCKFYSDIYPESPSEFFSVIAISEDVGVSKPDPRIFLEACRMAWESPSECWHIGDDFEADFKGSLSAGLKGVWINRNGSGPAKSPYAIKSLSELGNVIQTGPP